MDESTSDEIQRAIDADASTAVELAALMLDDEGSVVYDRAAQLPIMNVPSILCISSALIAILAERLAELEEISPEEILLELRHWSVE